MLIWPIPYRLEATHDPSLSPLSEFFFSPLSVSYHFVVLSSNKLSWLFGSQSRVKRQCSYWASFIVLMLCVNGMRHHRHHCSTLRTFFFSPSTPSPRNANPKSGCCKVRLSLSFSSIKLILSSVILTSTLAVQGGVRTPSSRPLPHFFSCFHSYIVMPSSRIFYETFRHPLYPENEKKTRRLWRIPLGRFQNAYDFSRRVLTIPPA